MSVSCECCVLCRKRPLRRTDHSSRGVLPSVYASLCVIRCYNNPLHTQWVSTRGPTKKYCCLRAVELLQCLMFVQLITFDAAVPLFLAAVSEPAASERDTPSDRTASLDKLFLFLLLVHESRKMFGPVHGLYSNIPFLQCRCTFLALCYVIISASGFSQNISLSFLYGFSRKTADGREIWGSHGCTCKELWDVTPCIVVYR
jgi:hypothetical protein